MNLEENLAMAYRDYFNNYLTIETFAIDYKITKDLALKLIELGKYFHENGY